ncbi:DUF6481 family protein [Sphingomonas oligophenolica]|uniref:Uncharacterized protein n=1 Tax=Sphingomonas oligophenolica TaxID=301154 RepID=A0A502CI99_9SPHN|nr:DUF6481 family protein [Sphingomonas oligophenolica]TPG12360.1 hypothetical protein EAH84_09335 [Sphingomonas oligophenolica]
MAGFKTPDFNERTEAARVAKQKALDQLRSKPAPDPAVVAERQAAAEAREKAAAERRAERKRAAETAKAAKAASEAPKPVETPAAPAPVEAPKPTEEELKAARDARYAARKKRKR